MEKKGGKAFCAGAAAGALLRTYPTPRPPPGPARQPQPAQGGRLWDPAAPPQAGTPSSCASLGVGHQRLKKVQPVQLKAPVRAGSLFWLWLRLLRGLRAGAGARGGV